MDILFRNLNLLKELIKINKRWKKREIKNVKNINVIEQKAISLKMDEN